MRMKTQRILAALLSLVLLLALAPAGWADGDGAIPLKDLKVVINLTPGTDAEFNAEIVKASVQADLYLITKAKPVEGYDTYEYEKLTGDLATFQKDLDDALKTNPSDPKEMASEIATQPLREESMLKRFTSLAYDMAEVVLADNFSAVTPKSFPAAEGASTIEAGGLEAGLYLLVLRGSNLTNKHLMLPKDAKPEDQKDYGYVTETEKKLSDYGPDGTVTKAKHIATRAFSDKYEFLFEPQLITVPTRVDEKTKTELQYNTAFGVWSNELDLNIKAAKEDRTGKIKVKKTLSYYYADISKDETFEPAMFTFEVVATKTKDRSSKELYQRQVSINIESRDMIGKTEVLKDLPAGSYAWVTEIYQGAHYQVNTVKNAGPIEVKADKLVIGEDGVTTIQEEPDDKITAEFDNTSNNTHRGGHGIENKFTFSKTKGAWSWVPTGGEGATSGSGVEEK